MIRKGVAALIFFRSDNGIRYLLLKRKNNWVGWEWLKGGCNQGEAEKACLKREIKEEVNVDHFNSRRTKFIHSFDYPKMLVKDDREWTGAAHRVYVIEAFSDKIKVDNEEHSGFRWVNEKDAPKLITWDNQKELFKKIVKIYIRK